MSSVMGVMRGGAKGIFDLDTMARAREEFKWFGEGFDGFPKQLSEDSVEYSVFVLGSPLATTASAAQLDGIRIAATRLVEKHLRDYVWQREKFDLQIATADGR